MPTYFYDAKRTDLLWSHFAEIHDLFCLVLSQEPVVKIFILFRTRFYNLEQVGAGTAPEAEKTKNFFPTLVRLDPWWGVPKNMNPLVHSGMRFLARWETCSPTTLAIAKAYRLSRFLSNRLVHMYNTRTKIPTFLMMIPP